MTIACADFSSGKPSVACVAVLGDTHANELLPTDNLTHAAAWISAHRVAKNIVAVLHKGDIVNEATTSAQWAVVADSGFPVAGIPNVWSPGNHDSDNIVNRVYTAYNAALPPASMSALAGVYVTGSSANSYSIFDIGGVTWLALALEYDPPDAVLVWAAGVLDAHPTTPTIVLTHSDLYHDGTLTDPTKSPRQNYVYTGLAGGDNYGQQIWDKVLYTRGQVALVVSGHDILYTYAYLGTAHPAGSMFPVCHHVLRNFQSYSMASSGNPFISLIGFDYTNNCFSFVEYSPPSLQNMYLPYCTLHLAMR